MLVQFDQNLSPEDLASLQAAYGTVGNTITGYALESQIENSPIIWTISNQGGAFTDYDSNTISVDPNFHPYIFTDSAVSSLQQASTDLILEHELGHVVSGPDENINVVENENPYESEMGYPLRLTYDLPKAFDPAINKPPRPSNPFRRNFNSSAGTSTEIPTGRQFSMMQFSSTGLAGGGEWVKPTPMRRSRTAAIGQTDEELECGVNMISVAALEIITQILLVMVDAEVRFDSNATRFHHSNSICR